MFLLFEQRFGTVDGLLRRSAEPSELHDPRGAGDGRTATAGRIIVEPAQQFVERAHTAVEDPDGQRNGGQQQQQVEEDHPIEDRPQQVVLLEGGSGDLQFVIGAVGILENRCQYAGRLGLLLFGNVDLGVVVIDMRTDGGFGSADGHDRIAVVRPVVRLRQFASREHPLDDQLRIVFQRIVGLVVDLVDHRKVEQYAPKRHQRQQGERQAQGDAGDEFHAAVRIRKRVRSRTRCGLFGLRRREFVPEAVDGFQLDGRAGLGEFAPQILHLGIDEMEVVRVVGMVAPDGFGQHGLVDQMVRALHEVEQDVELLFQQRQFASLHLHAPALRPER